MEEDLTPFEVIVLMFALVGGGAPFGAWVGQMLAHVLWLDRREWAERGGFYGGSVGFALFLLTVVAKVGS